MFCFYPPENTRKTFLSFQMFRFDLPENTRKTFLSFKMFRFDPPENTRKTFLSFQMIPFDASENTRKTLSFQGDQKGTLGRNRLSWGEKRIIVIINFWTMCLKN